MKKMVCAALLAALGAVSATAAESFQVSYWFGVPDSTVDSTVEGLKLGLPISSGNGLVDGAEIGITGSTTANIDGFQWCLVGPSWAKTVDGMQFSWANFAEKSMSGVQLAFFNFSNQGGIQIGLFNNSNDNAEYQFGLLNFNTNGWFPFMPFFNMAGEKQPEIAEAGETAE